MTELASMAQLGDQIKACHKCVGMNRKRISEALPGWGSVTSPVVIVGQSLCKQCMDAKEPFYKRSGVYIDKALEMACTDGTYKIEKKDLFITNLVHCHPPHNRPSKQAEIDHCKGYLFRELALVKPVLVIGLGKDARVELLKHYGDQHLIPWPLATKPRVKPKTNAPYLLFPEHPGSLRFKHTADREYWAPSLARAIEWSFDVR